MEAEKRTGNGPLLLRYAAGQYWNETGQHHRDSARWIDVGDHGLAARQHQRLESIEEVLRLRDDLVCDIDRLYGIAVTPASAPDTVLLWFICRGC